MENSSLFQHTLSWSTLALLPPTDRQKSSFLCVLSPTSTHGQDSYALSLSRQPVPKEDDNLTNAVCLFFPFTTWKKVLPHFGGQEVLVLKNLVKSMMGGQEFSGTDSEGDVFLPA